MALNRREPISDADQQLRVEPEMTERYPKIERCADEEDTSESYAIGFAHRAEEPSHVNVGIENLISRLVGLSHSGSEHQRTKLEREVEEASSLVASVAPLEGFTAEAEGEADAENSDVDLNLSPRVLRLDVSVPLKDELPLNRRDLRLGSPCVQHSDDQHTGNHRRAYPGHPHVAKDIVHGIGEIDQGRLVHR